MCSNSIANTECFLFVVHPPWGRFLSALRPRFPCRMTHQLGSLRRVLSSFWSLWRARDLWWDSLFWTVVSYRLQLRQALRQRSAFGCWACWYMVGRKGSCFYLHEEGNYNHLWTGFLIPHMGPISGIAMSQRVKNAQGLIHCSGQSIMA